MKKTSIVTGFAILLNLSQAWAQPFICPFTDYFTISSVQHAVISSLSSDGNVIATKLDPMNFITTCKSNTSTENGFVYVTLKVDDKNLCTFHILDGPYEMNPIVVFVNCVGSLKFTGLDHVWGTYQYTVKLSS